MSLEELMGRIEMLQERIRRHATLLRESETRTRMALIDPILNALGWHVHDPELVLGEYRVGGGQADYALVDRDGRPLTIVEAKKLGTDLVSHRRQMLNYAVEAGIKYAAITDGNNWEVYKVFEPVKLDEKRVLEVSILNDTASASALRLLLLWRPNLSTGSPVKAVDPVIEPGLDPDPPGWVPLATYNPKAGTTHPSAIRYWDGNRQNIKQWYEILSFVVDKLYHEGTLTKQDLPIVSTSKTSIANSEPKHPDGRAYVSHACVANDSIYVNTNLNAKQARQNAKKVLQVFHKDPATVMLQVAG